VKRITVTASTIGQQNASQVSLSGGYRYKGRPGWPFDPASRDGGGVIEGPKGGAKVRAQERERRSDEYGKLRDQGVPKAEAAERIGVQRKTGARYEAAWKASQPGGSDD
jgi:hypothetical protein